MDAKEPESLTELVALYLSELREKPDLSPDEFAARFPGPQREALLDHCEAARLAYGMMQGQAPRDPWQDPRGVQIAEYTIVDEIGRGGMGIVFRAEQASLGRDVALKVLPPSWNLSERACERFRREGMAIAKLDDPRIVRVYSVGEHDGVSFMAMELVDGHSVHDEICALRGDECESAPAGPRALGEGARHARARELASFFARCARALQSAHEAGVIHRDISSKNILVDARGEPRIIDFGLARILEDPARSMTGVLVGTPGYMSPEQAGLAGCVVDHRTDIYSLAVVLYEALALERPFVGESQAEVIEAVRVGVVRPLRELDERIPEDLSSVVAKAMSRRPEERFASARDFADELERFASGLPTRTRAPGLTERSRRWLLARRRFLIGAGVVAAASGLGVLAGAVRGAPRARLVIEREDLRGVDVYLRRVDIATWSYAQAEHLGTAPLRVSVPLGPCRIVLKRGEEFAELFRDFGEEGFEYAIDSPVHLATLGADASMATIPEARVQLGREMASDGGMLGLSRRTVELPSFRIDRFEVCFGDYRRFVAASAGRFEPPDWVPRGAAWNEEWNDLPACGISHTAARALAEWMGKRLPTADEWELAARGPASWVLPWQAEAASLEEIRARARIAVRVGSPAWKDFLSSVVTVSDPSYVQNKAGLVHILGNVSEWTETAHRLRNDDGSARRERDWMIAKGGSFRDEEWVPAQIQYAPSFISVNNIGLRCAVSMDPLG